MDRPAAAFEDFVDKDGGITLDAAIAWMRVAYGRSEWAARKEFKRALASGNVPLLVTRNGYDRWEDISEYSEDEDGPVNEELQLPLLRRDRASKWEQELLSREQPNEKSQGRFIRDRRYNADDLRWQIEQQLAKLVVPTPKRQSSTASRGRPEAPHWALVYDQVIDPWLEENGCPVTGDGEQAKLEKFVADYLDSRMVEGGPSESTIRLHVVKRMAKKKKADGPQKADKAEK
jgi:hypothetical protein